jgi:hypothetical protein
MAVKRAFAGISAQYILTVHDFNHCHQHNLVAEAQQSDQSGQASLCAQD